MHRRRLRARWPKMTACALSFTGAATRAAVSSLLNSAGRRCVTLENYGLPGLNLQAPPAGARIGVMLVHGLGSDAHAMRDLQQHLHELGYPTVALTYGTYSGTLERFAQRIDRAAATFRTSADVDSVIVIAHSLGGLAARWAAVFGTLDDIACEIITVCSPHRGAPLASLPGLDRLPVLGGLLSELRPGSAALTKLAEARAACRSRWVTYASEGDEFVPVENAALISEGLTVDNRIAPSPVSHVGALSDPGLLAELAREVQNAAAAFSPRVVAA